MKKILRIFSAILCTAMLAGIMGVSVSAQTLKLTSSTLIITEGKTASLKLSGASGTTYWKSSDGDVCKYSKGKVRAVGSGAAYIYAKNGDTTLKCKIIVVDADNVFSDSRESMTIDAGESVYISVDISDMDSVKNKLSGSKYVKVSKAGSSKGKTAYKLTGKKQGTAKLTVYDKKDSSNKTVITIKVKPKQESASADIGNNDNASFSSTSESEIDEIIRLVNEQRKAAGLDELVKDERLCADAAVRANEIASYYSHTRPDGSECFTVITNEYMAAAENIAQGYGSAADVMDGWMNSAGHRANILGSAYNKIGVGYDSATKSYVQLFSD